MHGLKAQKAPSPGQAKRHPGLRGLIALTPCKGKSILYWIKNKASALTGRHLLTCFDPGCRFACPGLRAFGLSARALSAEKPCRKNMNFELFLIFHALTLQTEKHNLTSTTQKVTKP